MAVVDLVMPKLGESIMEATILKWHKKSGDPVQMDETVWKLLQIKWIAKCLRPPKAL